jgi:hypothetical protein
LGRLSGSWGPWALGGTFLFVVGEGCQLAFPLHHEPGDQDAAGEVSDATAGDDVSPDSGVTVQDGSAPSLAFVQVKSTNVAAVSSASLTFDADVGAHDAIVVAFAEVALTGTAFSNITDTLGNKYVVVVGPVTGNSLTNYIAVALDTAGGPDTVTITLTKPADEFRANVLEYTGFAPLVAFDVSAFVARGTSTAIDAMASGVATTRSDHELIFGYGTTGPYNGGQPRNAVAGTWFVPRSDANHDVIEDKIVDHAGAYQTTATMTVGHDWSMLMATFRAK